MEYLKLISLKVNDFCSQIFYEENFNISELDEAKKLQDELTKKGYICLITKMNSGLSVN